MEKSLSDIIVSSIMIIPSAQTVFPCSKSAMETPEQWVKSVQSKQ